MRYNFTLIPFNVCVCHSLQLFRKLSNSLLVYPHFCNCVRPNDVEHRIPSDVAYSTDGRCLLKLKQGISNVISHYSQRFFCFFAFIHLYHYTFPLFISLSLILRRSRTGTVWFYTSTSNKRAARPKRYTKSLTRDLKRMYSRLTLVRISINL